MKRTKKYPETTTFHYYNANSKNRITGDCTFRAICTALGQTWEETVVEMAMLSCETGYAVNDTKGVEKYMEKKGWIKHNIVCIKETFGVLTSFKKSIIIK